MKTCRLSYHAGVLLLLSAAAGDGAQFSFTEDFLIPPDHANTPTNVWQFFYRIDMGQRTGMYERLPVYDNSIQNSGTEGWRARADYPPYIGKHLQLDALFPYIALGEGHIHPANDGRGVAIGFRAPSNGVYEVSVSIRAAGGGSINWYLDKNPVVLASGMHLRGGGSQDFHAPQVNLKGGEFVFLVVDSDGNWFADSTAVAFVVQPATEPPHPSRIRFNGEPGASYRLQRVPTPTGAWTASPPQTAPASGEVEFWDLFPPPGQAFYPTVQPQAL